MLALSKNTSDRVKLLTLSLVVRNIKISCVFRKHLHALPHFGTLLVEFFIMHVEKARESGQLPRACMLLASYFAG